MKVAIIGSRDYTDYESMCNHLDVFLPKGTHCIISGGATGADGLAEKFAIDNRLDFIKYPAEWKKYGDAAGPIRNEKIVKAADCIIAFWNGTSRGTLSTIRLANKFKKHVLIIYYTAQYE